ncbi:MAG TPA: FtsQ-type POTRA domain-containing protein [Candidatus Acidoferrum sp.]|nr:FtsQ-type POTRA domain-containing protein [Candidatus Acidoferrum sp.]
MRVKVATLAAGLSLGTIFTVYVAWRCGDWALDRFVYQNQAFRIEQIDLYTDGILATDQLRRWAGVKKQENLFALDLTRVKRDLELVPAIQSVAVERILPHTLRIRVCEREPVAHVQNYLVDANGYVMIPPEAHHRAMPPQSNEHYPSITGVSAKDVRLGKEMDSPQVRAALRFISAFERSHMATVVDLTRIDVSQPEVLQVTTAQQNEVTFRGGDFERQLNRWWLVYDNGLKHSRQIASLDLSVEANVPLRWLDTATAPLPPTKLRKSSPYKKRHV